MVPVEPRPHPQLSATARVILLVIMAAILTTAIVFWTDLETWLRSAGNSGLAVFAGVLLVLSSCCFPVSLLGFTAGYVYGPVQGYGVLAVSVLASGSLMFGLGRSSLRGLVADRLARDRRLAVLQDMAAGRALRLNLLARLSPFNYGLVCYTLAAGPTGWRDYLLGLSATLPGLAIQVAVGVVARRGFAPEAVGPWRVVGTIIGVGALLVLGWQISRMARQAWQTAAREQEEERLHDQRRD